MSKLFSLLAVALSMNAFAVSPVIRFSAEPGNSKVDLKWEAAPEKGAIAYVIERSKDGELWAEILRVTASESSDKESFMESDYSPIAGVSYYRLKKVYADGLYAYSNISVVKNNGNLLQTSTLPLNEQDFSGYSNEEILIVLSDLKGNEYYSKIYLIEQPQQLVGFDLEDKLHPGKYIVTASSFEGLVSQPLEVK